MTFTARSIFRLLLVFILILVVIFAASRGNPQITGEMGEDIDVGMTVPDMSFFSAETINLNVTSSDDVFAAGGTIKVDGTSADHLVIAGGEIQLRNIAVEDLIAAGGDLRLSSGTATDDIVVVGGDVIVGPAFGIGGSAVAAGGDVRFEAAVPVDLRVGAGSVYVNSVIGGDARLTGDTVTLGPQARIGGDLLYRTENLVLQPGAVVVGERTVMPPEEYSAAESWGRGAGELFTKLAIAVTLGFALLVVAIAIAVPGLMRSSAKFIESTPWKSLGIGVVFAVGVPLLIILLFASVVGAPLALLIGAICLAVTPVAVAATAYLLGMLSRRVITKSEDPPTAWSARLLWPVLGAAVILLLGMIPFLGLLVWLFAMLLGLGAVVSRGGKALATAS